jgi:hypothetical protein
MVKHYAAPKTLNRCISSLGVRPTVAIIKFYVYTGARIGTGCR